MKNKPNFFLAGWPKSGTTWLYKCFAEHPDVFVTDRDAVHFFSINYFRGDKWYERFYQNVKNEKLITDLTPNYILDPDAAERIKKYNPNAKLLFVIRNPVDRAFSHYWHQKRKKRINFTFDDVLHYSEFGNFDMYQMVIRPGFYFDLLQPFFRNFKKEQLKIVTLDELQNNPNEFIEDIFEFAEIDSSFKPTILHKKVNQGKIPNELNDKGVVDKVLEKIGLKLPSNEKLENEYNKGIQPEYRKELMSIFLPQIIKLEENLGLDLKKWKEN